MTAHIRFQTATRIPEETQPMDHNCPACRAPRRPGQYLCPSCWSALPAHVRRALSRRDKFAMLRLRELHKQLENTTPLDRITVTP